MAVQSVYDPKQRLQGHFTFYKFVGLANWNDDRFQLENGPKHGYFWNENVGAFLRIGRPLGG